jgi:acyl carrier protein
MAYPDSFTNWWQKQPTFKAHQSHFISSALYEALTRIAFNGWRAHERKGDLKGRVSSMTLFKEIGQIVSKKLNQEKEEEEKITLKTSFVDDLGMDSFDLVELFMSFEDHFNIEIPDEEIEKAKTIKDVIDLVRKQL